MGYTSARHCVNLKAIFCIALFAILTNLVLTQNLYTSLLDDTRNALMSYSSGSSSLPPAKPPLKHYVAVSKGWGSRRRRRRRYVVKSTKAPPVKKRTSPSNKFLEALDQIERAVYEAQAAGSRYHYSTRRLKNIKANIKLATQKRNYLFARQSLGHGIYSAMQLAKKIGRKRRTATSSAVKTFMDSIKKELGPSTFDTFMSVNGDVTLMFAVDDTGSMGDDIRAAKDIAKSIVHHERDETVDYILSPFNDPGTGPVTYRSPGQKEQFVTDIEKLRPHAGGDCPELTFKGILDAMAASPKYGSPLYVFTDATAKDYTKENLEEVLWVADETGITINFFTTGLCGRSSYEPFEKMAKETCGQLFKLPNAHELRKLSGVTAGALAGATCLEKGDQTGSASGTKKKRSLSRYTYTIPIDDSTEKIIISVTTERMNPTITLKDPRGNSVTSGKIYLSRGAIYEINHPRPGTWKLTVSRAGKHSYQVKGSSKTNIDFEHFFVMIPSRGRTKRPIPISHPLLGRKALVIITVAGAKMINSKTLKLDLISKDGRRLGTTNISPRGTSGAHFSASFTPPSAPFSLKLRGKTKKGYSFQRNSRNLVHPSHALIRVLYARNEFTVPRGRTGFVVFVVYNTGKTERFDIKVKDRLKYVARLRRTSITVRKGRKSFFSVTFKAPYSAARGSSNEVLATVTGRTSKKTVGHVVRLMVV